VNPDLLLLFTRYPEPGKVKTRLIPALGAEGAANVQQSLTVHILQLARAFTLASTTDLIVCFDGSQVRQMQHLFGAEFCYLPQSPGDLGQRMFSALAEALRQGRRRVVLMGSDCPEITAQILSSAFSQLALDDLVLGPARDGGYYLIGLTAPYPELFQDLPWGTDEVLALTQTRAAQLGLKTALLEPLTDIDRPEDLPGWEKITRQAGYE
jgi:uncharacterized protein